MQDILDYYASLQDKTRPETIVSLLRELQECLGYIPPDIKTRAAEAVGVKHSLIDAIIRRYPSLKDSPDRHEITLCSGSSCGSKRSRELIHTVETALGVDASGLSRDGSIRVIIRNCLKKCGTAPNMMIDGKLYPCVQQSELQELLKALK